MRPITTSTTTKGVPVETLGSPGLRHEIRCFDSLESLKQLHEDWDELANSASNFLLSMSYHYCELAAALALEEGATIAVVMVRDGSGLAALWPFAIRRRGVFSFARLLTSGNHEEYGRFLVRGSDDRSLVAELTHALMDLPADVLQVPNVEDGSALSDCLRWFPQGRLLPITSEASPGYSIGLGRFARWEDFSSTLSKSMLSDMRRCYKRLCKQADVEFGWCRTADDAISVLNWLFTNKRIWATSRRKEARWLANDKVRDFYIALAQRLDLANNPLVAYVKVDGVPVAASVNAVGRQTIEYCVTTYDEAFRRFGVGMLLIEFLAKWAHANGLSFDFRPQQADYKIKWADQTTHYRSVIIFLSARGRLLEIPLVIRRLLSRLTRR